MKVKITLVLLLVLLLNTVTAGAYMMPGDTFDAYSSSLDVLCALDIIETEAEAEKAVTRAEFAGMVIRALNVSGTARPDGSISDVSESDDYAAAIYTMKQMELISDTKFRPGEEITFNEAIAVLDKALGYGELAELKGGYPAGYLVCAKSADIIKNVTASGESALTYRDAVIMLYNFINADIYSVEAFEGDNVIRKKEKGKNILTENFDFEITEGVIKSAGHMSMTPGFDESESVIEVGGDTYKCSIDGAEKYLGLNARVFYDDTDTVRAVYVDKDNKLYTVAAEDVKTYSKFRLKTKTDSSKEKEYKFDPGFTFVKNGRIFTPNSASFELSDGYFVLIDSDSDKYIDTVLAFEYRYIVVSSKSNVDNKLYDISGRDFVSLKRENGYWYDLHGIDKNGNGIELVPEDIEKNSVVSICESEDGKYIDATVSVQTVEGTLETIDEDYVVIDSKQYKKNSYFDTNSQANVGMSGRFLLDADGRVTDIADNADSEYRYGYVIGVTDSEEEEAIYVKMIDQSGKLVRYVIAEKIKLDGLSLKNGYDDKVKDKLMKSGKAKYQLIRYKLNSESKIRMIDIASEYTSSDTLYKKYSAKRSGDDNLYINIKNSNAYLYASYNTFIPYGVIGQNTIVFQVPKCIADSENLIGSDDKRLEKYSEKNFKIISPSELENDTYLIDMYNMNDKLQPDVIIVYEGDPQSSPTPDRVRNALVVEKVKTTVNEDNVVTKEITAWRDGTFKTYTLNEELYEELGKNNGFPKPGDIIRITTESADVISGLTIDVSYDRENGVPKMIDPGESQIYDVGYCGRLFSVGDGALVLKVETAPGWQSSNSGTIKDELAAFSVTSDTYFARYVQGEGVKSIKADELSPGSHLFIPARTEARC